jgi:hypothetical protein
MPKKNFYRLIWLNVLVLTLSFWAHAQNKLSVVGFNNFGGVKVGMTAAQGSKWLGVRLVSRSTDSCRYYSAKGFGDIGFMVNDGTIARFDVFNRNYATERGAKVGDTEARIKSLYKGIFKVTKHAYTDGHYITVMKKGTKYGIVFETDGKRVVSFHAGRKPELEYIEGCA